MLMTNDFFRNRFDQLKDEHVPLISGNLALRNLIVRSVRL
jgi:hypothetical protein